MLRRGEDRQQRAEAPAVARYVSETGQSFIFDRTSHERALLRFDGSAEVWVLAAQYAPRGDILYKNDLGRTMVRLTRVGGLTIFTSDRPDGAAAAPSGATAPLKLSVLNPGQLFKVLTIASGRASHAAQRLIPVEAPAVTPESSAVIGDAALVAAEAMLRLSRRGDGRTLLARVSKIVIEEGARAGVFLDGGSLRIIVAPSLYLSGRPSSDRICWVVGAR
jgi:hypothetical protein